MANLEERIRAIVREETGQEAAPGGGIDSRLKELELQVDDLRKDFQSLMADQVEGESRPGGQ